MYARYEFFIVIMNLKCAMKCRLYDYLKMKTVAFQIKQNAFSSLFPPFSKTSWSWQVCTYFDRYHRAQNKWKLFSLTSDFRNSSSVMKWIVNVQLVLRDPTTCWIKRIILRFLHASAFPIPLLFLSYSQYLCKVCN